MVGTCISMHLVRCECEILLMLLSVATLDWNHWILWSLHETAEQSRTGLDRTGQNKQDTTEPGRLPNTAELEQN